MGGSAVMNEYKTIFEKLADVREARNRAAMEVTKANIDLMWKIYRFFKWNK